MVVRLESGISANDEDIAVLVIDWEHERYGHIGKLKYHDDQGHNYLVLFVDGQECVFCDLQSDSFGVRQQAEVYYWKQDKVGDQWDERGRGPDGLIRKCADLGLNFPELESQYNRLFREVLV